MSRDRLSIARDILAILGAVFFIITAFYLPGLVSSLSEEPQTEASLSAPSDSDYRILFIDSYSPTHATYADKELGLQLGLYPNNISYNVFYMDTKNYSSQHDIEEFQQFLEARLEDKVIHYDGVIAGDDAALSFTLKYHRLLFPDLPILFYGVNNLSLAHDAARDPHIAGYLQNVGVDLTIDYAAELLPKATQIVCITDNSASGIGSRNQLFELQESYPQYTFREINSSALTHEEFCAALEELTQDDIVIFVSAASDADGNIYTVPEGIRIILDHTSVPIFSNNSGGKGNGLLAGAETDFVTECRLVGYTMASVLNGQIDTRDLQVLPSSSSRMWVDYSVMKSFHLNTDLIPENAVVLNAPEDMLARYLPVLIPATLIILSLLCFLCSMTLNYMILSNTNEKLTAAKEQLRKEAEYDSMLNVYNSFIAESMIEQQLRERHPVCVLRIDLDDFSNVNENYGYRIGDKYMKFLATSIKEYGQQHNLVFARYTGDEFYCIAPDRHLTEESTELRDLHALFSQSMQVGIEYAHTSASIGAVNSDETMDCKTMLLYADIALKEAKNRGKNTTVFYASELQTKLQKVNEIKTVLDNAVHQDGFYLMYQPKISAEDQQITGFEALVRIKDSTLTPSEFIPVAEKSGYISSIGRIVTELSIRQLAEWRDKNLPLYPVSINFSSHQAHDKEYVTYLSDLLRQYQVPADLIQVEITESLLVDESSNARQMFAEFKELGMKILMDDFGTGYSALNYITYLPIDTIKLDRSLVQAFLVPEKESFIRNIIHLIHDLGMHITIEGVEHEWQYERLKEFHADDIQGFYFSRPLLPQDAEDFILQHTHV